MQIDHRSLISSAKRLARVAGAVYLLIAFLSGAARLGVRAGIPVPGYAPPADSTAVQVSVVAAIAVATLFALVGVTLYLLLRHVDQHAAGPWVVYVAVATGMIVVNLLFHQAVLLAATGPLSATGGARDSGGLVALLLDMHDHGYTLAAVVFCLWLVALGHLAYQSTRYPGVLSILLIVSLIVATVTRFLWPDLPTVVQTILAPPAVADLWLIAYLVTKGGIRVPANNVVPTAISA